MKKYYEVKVHPATNTKCTRIRVLGLSNKFIAKNYKYNSVLDQAMEILEKEFGNRENWCIKTHWCDKNKSYFITTKA